MFLVSLQSGSAGNCVYIESESTRLLFDGGLSATQVEQRLAQFDRDPRSVDAMIISHEHYDHVRHAGMCSKKFGIPIFITKPTYAIAKRYITVNDAIDVHHFKAGDTIKFEGVRVETVCTPHDAVDGVVFVIDDGQHRIGICTDVGHVYEDLKSVVKSVDGLFLESNFDERMLENGHYPYMLKKRISGPGGHISNREAAELVSQNASSKLQWLSLAHLSDKNNTLKKALAAHKKALGPKLHIQLTSRNSATDMLETCESLEHLPIAEPQLTFDL